MVKTLVTTDIFCPSSELEKVVKECFRPSLPLQVMLVTDLLSVSTDFTVVTLVSEDTFRRLY